MDQQILFLINHTWTHPGLDRAMVLLSSFDFWWPFLLLLVLAVAIWGSFRLRAMVLAIGLAVAISDPLVVNGLKHLVGRLRPYQATAGVRTIDFAKAKPRFLAIAKPLKEHHSDGLNPPARGVSFPSGHTSNCFAVAAVCWRFYRRRGWLVLILAAGVGYSRVYVGAHWPSDVAISALIGFAVGLLAVALLNAAWKRWGGKLLPEVRKQHPTLLEA